MLQDLNSIRTRLVEEVSESLPISYDASLLRGRGVTPEGVFRDMTLAELADLAREKNVFLAFEPED